MDYHQELFVIKMEETPEVIKKLEQSEKKVANMYQLKSNQRRCHIISGCFFILLRTFQNPQNSWNQGRHNTKSREYRKALVIDKCLSSH